MGFVCKFLVLLLVFCYCFCFVVFNFGLFRTCLFSKEGEKAGSWMGKAVGRIWEELGEGKLIGM